MVCAACHGPTGVSVSDSIPNLAAQRATYIEAQLKALKDGTRKNLIMNAIAAQLSADEIANVAVLFCRAGRVQRRASKSALLPNVVITRVTFPEDYKDTFTKYHTINFPATNQVRYYFANRGRGASGEGRQKRCPTGSVLFAEVYAAKLDADKNPVMGNDGFFVPDKLLFYTAMARESGWGKDFPEMLRNGDWNYAVFTTDKQQRDGSESGRVPRLPQAARQRELHVHADAACQRQVASDAGRRTTR